MGAHRRHAATTRLVRRCGAQPALAANASAPPVAGTWSDQFEVPPSLVATTKKE
jgi:hypothetical protein